MRRFLSVLLATISGAAVGVLAPALADANHWWFDGGSVRHLNRGHMPALSFYNNATNGSATGLEHARGEWSANWSMDLYNVTSSSADVVAWDGAWCTNWSGLATAAQYQGAGHFNQGWVQINTCTFSYAVGANYRGVRAVGCQEIGHVIGGMLHEGPGCMGFSYQGVVPAGSNNLADDLVLHPYGHDWDHLQHLWAAMH